MIFGVDNVNTQQIQNQKYELSNNNVESFDEILKPQKCGYSRFAAEARQLFANSFSCSYFNKIDITGVPLWKRKDFPKNLTFKENCTQEELNKVKMPYPEPIYNFDPEVQDVWGDIATENCVSFIIHPKAAEKLESDPDFYKKVMENVMEILPLNCRSRVAADFEALGHTLIDMSVFITIGENGGVSFEGYCSGMQKIKPGEEQDTEEEDKKDNDGEVKIYHKIDSAAFDLTSDEAESVCNDSLETYNINLAYLAADYIYGNKR